MTVILNRRFLRSVSQFALWLALAFTAACGGGGGGSDTTDTTTDTTADTTADGTGEGTTASGPSVQISGSLALLTQDEDVAAEEQSGKPVQYGTGVRFRSTATEESPESGNLLRLDEDGTTRVAFEVTQFTDADGEPVDPYALLPTSKPLVQYTVADDAHEYAYIVMSDPDGPR